MALIKCKECGKQISDKAEECPHCGYPISNESDTICAECGTLIHGDVNECPNCGCPIEYNGLAPQSKGIYVTTDNYTTKQNRSRNVTLKIVCVVLAVAVLGLSLALIHKGASTSNDYEMLQETENQQENEISIEDRIKAVESLGEARTLLNGTTWHYTENLSKSEVGGWIKVVFDHNSYTTYYAQPSDGKWTEGGKGTYQLKEGRYSNTGERYIAVEWNGDMKIDYLTIPCQFSMTLDTFQLNVRSSLIDGMANMSDRMAGRSYYYSASRGKTNLVGQMVFGDYVWN